MEPFATRLSIARSARKMTMRTLGEKAGITSSSISEYEEGNKNPSLDRAIKLAGALGCPYDWLFGTPEELDERKGVRTHEQTKMPWEEEK